MNREQVTFIMLLLAAPASVSAQTNTGYIYDALGRLTSVSTNNGTASTYQLDPASNRTRATMVNQFMTVFEAESLPHQVGFAEANGWGADSSTPQGFMTFGPYTTSIPTGQHIAVWRVMIDNNSGSQDVAHLEVRDNNTGETLALRSIVRSDFPAIETYQVFQLPFTMDASRVGHGIELRTLQFGFAHLLIDKIGY